MDTVKNSSKEKLSLKFTIKDENSRDLIILCHGMFYTKDSVFLPYLDEKLPYNTLSFDFSGNGESEGVFSLGEYHKEVDDIHAVVDHAVRLGYRVIALIGHSKGANDVLLYSAKYGNVPLIIPIAGRMRMSGNPKFLEKYLDQIENEGKAIGTFHGKEFVLTKEGLEDRRRLDMEECLRNVRNYVCVIHGTADTIIPVEDAQIIKEQLGEHAMDLKLIPDSDHYFYDFENELLRSIQSFLSYMVPILNLRNF
jgi:alpha/beta superfamily hydrolase